MRKIVLLVVLCLVGLVVPAGLALAGPDSCPPASPNGGNPVACGIDHNDILKHVCPDTSPNHGGQPPCGVDHNGGGGTVATCPPAAGIVSGAIVSVGQAVNGSSPNPLGDGLIMLGCALSGALPPLL